MSTYNLNSEKEYFEFTIFGGQYRFRLPNMEESERFDEIERNDEKLSPSDLTKKRLDFMYGFISKISEDGDEFRDVAKKMNANHWKNFNEMLKTELT